MMEKIMSADTQAMRLTTVQLNALRELSIKDTHLTRGTFGNVCATLFKRGLAEFHGYKFGMREFSITAAGRAAIAAAEGRKP